MQAITIITALLAGWAWRRKAHDILDIRHENAAKREAKKLMEAHRPATWNQIDAIRNDYVEGSVICR